MSSIPSNLSRVSTQLSSDLLLTNLRRTNVELLRAQVELSTGRRVNHPSDAPQFVSALTGLQSLLERLEQYDKNLTRSSAIIDVTDQALTEVSNLLIEAQGIALSQIGVGSDAATRRAQAEVVSALISSLRDITARQHDGVYLFGGNRSDVNPFTDALGGVRYVGATTNLRPDLGANLPIEINTNGAEALGALSSRVVGTTDLNPNATNGTRIAHVNGARQAGVTLGTVRVTVDGGSPIDVDLTGSDTIQDIVTRISNAVGAAGSLTVAGNGFTLTANAGRTIDIADIGTGVTAGDLGIVLSAASNSVAGADLDPKLNPLTDLAALGVAVDFASGLKITNGDTTKVIDLSAATTVQDVLNAVNDAGLGVRMRINDAATGFDLLNEISGLRLSVGENAGGSTATDLGIRTFADGALLSDLNEGLGVRTVTGQADFRITLHSGATVDVNLDGLTTAGQVIAAINAAGGGGVTATFAADGNGITLTDNTGAGVTFSVTALNNSFAAEDLGLLQNAGAANVINGSDVAPVRSNSVFTHLMMLREGLLNNNDRLITLAGEALRGDVDRVATAHASVGVRARRIAEQIDRFDDRRIQTQSLLSDLRDTDYAEAISRFSQLQQQLEAALLTGRQTLQLSLLDFLR